MSIKHTATFNTSRRILTLWLSPNCFGERDCLTIAEALRLIDQSGVPLQKLKVVSCK